MKIRELIRELQSALEKHGDLEVAVWADHGQTCQNAWAVGVQFRDNDGETVTEEDLDDPEEELCRDDFQKVLEIAG